MVQTTTTGPLTEKRRAILEFIDEQLRDRGFPPSVREIGQAVNLTSPSTVHAHLQVLQNQGYLKRDSIKPRAIEVSWDPSTDAVLERRPTKFVPIVGSITKGTDVLAEENLEELVPLPQDFTGEGQVFMLQMQGDSMIDEGILNGDYLIVRKETEYLADDIIVAGLPGDETTVKIYSPGPKGDKITLKSANKRVKSVTLLASDVEIHGLVVSVLRKY